MQTIWQKLLERARWAPSADNTQPWRFSLDEGANVLKIHYRPGQDMGVFCLDHYTGHLALGGLLETLDLAAGAQGYKVRTHLKGDADALVLEIELIPRPQPPDDLAAHIETRSTQRGLLSTQPLGLQDKHALEAALPDGYQVVWRESSQERKRLASYLSTVGRARLLMPETYVVHRDTVDWQARFSEDRIPVKAINADPLTRHIMAWAMRSPRRVAALNRMLGHWLPRFEMDYLPARACAAHFLLVCTASADTPSERLAHGRAMQRFWLAAARQNLQFQPEMAPCVFGRYLRTGLAFTRRQDLVNDLQAVDYAMARYWGEDNWRSGVFMGRLGRGRTPGARSLRKPLAALMNIPSE